MKFFSFLFPVALPTALSKSDTPESIWEKYTLEEFVQKKMHHGRDYFINPYNRNKIWSPWKGLAFLFSKNHFEKFYKDEPVSTVFIDWREIWKQQGLSITFINHACLMIKDGKQSILIDPIFKGLPFFKNFTPLGFDVKSMPKPDFILITHGHYDHLDKSSLSLLGPGPHVITPLGYKNILDDIKIDRLTELDWFDSVKSDDLEIILLPAYHWTMRNPFVGPNRSLWGSFLIRTSNGLTIFISGDIAYAKSFSQLGEIYEIDLAIFNLGAYEPRWFMAQSHMNPEETVRAFEELNAKQLSIVHWGTFRLGHEPVHFPPLKIKEVLTKKGLSDRLVEFRHGQTLFF